MGRSCHLSSTNKNQLMITRLSYQKQAKQPDTAALQKCIYVSVRTRVRVSVSASARLHDMPV